MVERPYCKATKWTTKDGRAVPCNTHALQGDEYCQHHLEGTDAQPARLEPSSPRKVRGDQVRGELKDDLGARYSEVIGLLDAAISSTKAYPVKCPHPCCQQRRRFDVPFPDIATQLKAVDLFISQGLGKPDHEPEKAPDLSADPMAMTAVQRAAVVMEVLGNDQARLNAILEGSRDRLMRELFPEPEKPAKELPALRVPIVRRRSSHSH